LVTPLTDRPAMVRALAGRRTYAADHPINGRSPITAPPDDEEETPMPEPNGQGGGTLVYLVRHGATQLNNTTDTSQDRIRGWTDVPLTDEGREEAAKAAADLQDKNIGYLATSDLSRAKETADIIGQAIGVKPVAMRGLRPWDLGKFAGMSTKEALPQIAEYVQKRPGEPVPGGESFDDFKARAFAGLADALNAAGGKQLAIVTHHRVERLMEAWQQAGQPASHAIDIPAFLEKGDPPGGVEELHVDAEALGTADIQSASAGGTSPAPSRSMFPAEVPPGLDANA
jgi:broad specificity phosphatase PhoE